MVNLYSLPGFRDLAERLHLLVPLRSGEIEWDSQRSGDVYVSLENMRHGETCVVLGAIAPPSVTLATLLMACSTLKCNGAGRVVLLLPYRAHCLAGWPEGSTRYRTSFLSGLLQSRCIDEVVTVDLHSFAVPGLLSVPLRSLSPAGLFADAIRHIGWQNATLVAMDNSSLVGVEDVLSNLITGDKRVVAEQVHDVAGVQAAMLGTGPPERAIVIDDVLGTGESLLSCCRALARVGANEVIVMATHSLYSGDCLPRLRTAFRDIYCTDTVPQSQDVPAGTITVISADRLLAEYLCDECQAEMSAIEMRARRAANGHAYAYEPQSDIELSSGSSYSPLEFELHNFNR